MPTDNKRRAIAIQKAIREVLLRDWDPIGVSNVPEAQDEYDAYIGRVYRLLFDGATDSEIKNYLQAVEAEWMGLSVAPAGGHLETVLAKLRRIEITL